MYDEGVINWESVLTLLLGIVIVSFVVLVLYRRRRAKNRKLQQEAEQLEREKMDEPFQTKETGKDNPIT